VGIEVSAGRPTGSRKKTHHSGCKLPIDFHSDPPIQGGDSSI
jgi:hypothetical protein